MCEKFEGKQSASTDAIKSPEGLLIVEDPFSFNPKLIYN
jgi:hypothetical protein